MKIASISSRLGRLIATSRRAPAVIRGVARRRVRIVWIGDSHAAAFVKDSRGLYRYHLEEECASLRLWIGPRLAFSVARDGVPVKRIERRLIRRLRPAAVVFVLGEIDVRTRLAKRGSQTRWGLNWVQNYVKTCEQFGRAVKAQQVLFVEAPPPSDLGSENPAYPRRGSLRDRVHAHRAFHHEIERAVTSGRLVRTADLLCGPDGSLLREVTEDGVHLSAPSAHRVVRRVLEAVE